MTLEELQMVYASLKECECDSDKFFLISDLEFARQRKEKAIKILRKEIKTLKADRRSSPLWKWYLS